MGTWIWLNIPFALLFFCSWAGIPLWLTLTRWNKGLNEKHAEIAAKVGPVPVLPQSVPAVEHETGSLAYTGAANPLGH